MADIAHNIKKYRKEAGYTQEWLANNLNVSQTAIALWESGTRTPSIDVIEKIADLLDVPPSLLMGWDERGIDIDYEIEEILTKLSHGNLTQEQVSLLVRKIESLIDEQKEIEAKTEEINSKRYNNTSAYFDSDEYTEEELRQIKRFAEFVKTQRKDPDQE